mmetsp:Transcript_47510/g.69491  ORF Transcript_47510/g.69491 Transcript_47510/m.69491 type:complete len:226 (+) Transcript_47510:78-755(+)
MASSPMSGASLFQALTLMVYLHIKLAGAEESCDLKLNGKCFDLVEQCLTYEEAKGSCLKANATLASSPSSQFQDLFGQVLPDSAWVWMGLSRVEEDEWTWEDGSEISSDDISWCEEEPNNWGGNEKCGCFVNEWACLIDLNCNAELPYICEYDSLALYDQSLLTQGRTCTDEQYDPVDTGRLLVVISVSIVLFGLPLAYLRYYIDPRKKKLVPTNCSTAATINKK